MTKIHHQIPAGKRTLSSIVPPSGFTANLTIFTAAVMAFLVVFALALSLAAGRLAYQWSHELTRSITIRVSAPEDQIQQNLDTVMAVLSTTAGIETARILSQDEQIKLLEPWFASDLTLETLPIPRLIEVIEKPDGPDIEGLRLRLNAEVSGTTVDDHTRWREPLADAAERFRLIGWSAVILITGAMAAIVTLAAQSALAANQKIISVLRLIGARDVYIARAFVRKFIERTFIGAVTGTAISMGIIIFLPTVPEKDAFLTGLGFQDYDWIWPLTVPIVATLIAYFATRSAAIRVLSKVS